MMFWNMEGKTSFCYILCQNLMKKFWKICLKFQHFAGHSLGPPPPPLSVWNDILSVWNDIWLKVAPPQQKNLIFIWMFEVTNVYTNFLDAPYIFNFHVFQKNWNKKVTLALEIVLFCRVVFFFFFLKWMGYQEKLKYPTRLKVFIWNIIKVFI